MATLTLKSSDFDQYTVLSQAVGTSWENMRSPNPVSNRIRTKHLITTAFNPVTFTFNTDYEVCIFAFDKFGGYLGELSYWQISGFTYAVSNAYYVGFAFDKISDADLTPADVDLANLTLSFGTDAEQGRNLFVYSHARQLYGVNDSGVIYTSEATQSFNGVASEYIPVIPGQDYTLSHITKQSAPNHPGSRCAWYDASKTFISRFAYDNEDYNYVTTVTAPANAAYAALSAWWMALGEEHSTLMFEKGNVAHPFRIAPEDLVAVSDVIVGQGQVSLLDLTDVDYIVTWYYLSDSLTPPAKPTTTTSDQTPTGWTTTEPAYTSGSTQYLYTCQQNVFGDGSVWWGDVSKSASFEAAKAAWNKAQAAQDAANIAYKSVPEFIIGTQTAATKLWTGNSTKFTTVADITDGTQITYWLPFATASEQKTEVGDTSANNQDWLQLTLADGVTKTDWIPCYYNGTTRLTSHYGANNAVRLTYRENVGSIAKGWWSDANYYSDSNTSYTQIASKVKVGVNGISRYQLLMQDTPTTWTRFTNSTGTGTSKPIFTNGFLYKTIAYTNYSTNTLLNANATVSINLFTNQAIDARYSLPGITASVGFTSNLMVFLVGTVANNLFYLDSTVWTQEPNNETKVYLPLGTAYSTYQLYLMGDHTAYVYRGSKLVEYEKWLADEAAKTATNYMNFDANDGLIIGNLTESTLGANVKIDSDSVDIRQGDTTLVTTEAVEKTDNAYYGGYVGINAPASSAFTATFNNGYTALQSTYNVHGQELYDDNEHVRTKLTYKKATTDLIDVINNGLEVYDETNALALFLGLAQVSTDVSILLQSLKTIEAYVNEKLSLNVFKSGVIINSLELGVDNNNNPTVDVLSPAAWRTGIGALCNTGDTVTGNITFKSSNITDAVQPSSNLLGKGIIFTDSGSGNSKKEIGFVSPRVLTNGQQGVRFCGERNGVTNVLGLYVDSSGSRVVVVSDQAAWCTGIGAVAKSGDTMTGELKLSGKNMRVIATGITDGTTPSSSTSGHGYYLMDSTGSAVLGYMRSRANNDGRQGIQITGKRGNGENTLGIYVDENNNEIISVSNQESWRVGIGANNASNLTTGTISADRIPGLAASKITSGTFDAARLPAATTSAQGALSAEDKTKLDRISCGADVTLKANNGGTATGTNYMLNFTSAGNLRLDSREGTSGNYASTGNYFVKGPDGKLARTKSTAASQITMATGCTLTNIYTNIAGGAVVTIVIRFKFPSAITAHAKQTIGTLAEGLRPYDNTQGNTNYWGDVIQVQSTGVVEYWPNAAIAANEAIRASFTYVLN